MRCKRAPFVAQAFRACGRIAVRYQPSAIRTKADSDCLERAALARLPYIFTASETLRCVIQVNSGLELLRTYIG